MKIKEQEKINKEINDAILIYNKIQEEAKFINNIINKFELKIGVKNVRN